MAVNCDTATLGGPPVTASSAVLEAAGTVEQKRSGRRPQGRRKRGKPAALVLEPEEESLFSLGNTRMLSSYSTFYISVDVIQ
jgi:hypothetical protein